MKKKNKTKIIREEIDTQKEKIMNKYFSRSVIKCQKGKNLVN